MIKIIYLEKLKHLIIYLKHKQNEGPSTGISVQTDKSESVCWSNPVNETKGNKTRSLESVILK
jgi:hypothetical protein